MRVPPGAHSPGYTHEVNVPKAVKALGEAIRAMAKQRAEDQKYIARLTTHMAKTEAYLAKTSPEHDRTRKWAEDNAKRLDAL